MKPEQIRSTKGEKAVKEIKQTLGTYKGMKGKQKDKQKKGRSKMKKRTLRS